MKDVPAERRQRVVESLISGDVCEKLLTYKQVSKDKMKSSCMDLLGKSKKNNSIGLLYIYVIILQLTDWNIDPGSHYDKFNSALLTKEPKHLDIVLCYEQSTACVGVKRLSSDVSLDNLMKYKIL